MNTLNIYHVVCGEADYIEYAGDPELSFHETYIPGGNVIATSRSQARQLIASEFDLDFIHPMSIKKVDTLAIADNIYPHVIYNELDYQEWWDNKECFE